MSDSIEDVKNSFIKAEPVMAAHIGAAAVGFAMSLLVTHGIVTTTQSSALTETLLPPVTALALLALGFLVRQFVTPAAKLAEKIQAGVEAKLNPPAGPKHAVAAMPAESMPALVAPVGSMPELVKPAT